MCTDTNTVLNKFVRLSAIKTRQKTFLKSETHLKLNIVLLVLWLCYSKI